MPRMLPFQWITNQTWQQFTKHCGPQRSSTRQEQVLLSYWDVSDLFFREVMTLLFRRLLWDLWSRDLTKSALRERTLSETFKKIRGPEGAAYKALLKSWTVHMPKWLWGGDLISICHQRYEASSIQVSEGCYQTEGGIGSVCLRNTDNQGLKWPKDTTKPNSRKRFLTMGSIFGKIRDYT